jgi:hypothetical protein
MKALVLMQIPKQDRDIMFDVKLQVAPSEAALATRDLSIRRVRAKPG